MFQHLLWIWIAAGITNVIFEATYFRNGNMMFVDETMQKAREENCPPVAVAICSMTFVTLFVFALGPIYIVKQWRLWSAYAKAESDPE